jgi:hypothetical protein
MESAAVPAGFRFAERTVTNGTLGSEPAPPEKIPRPRPSRRSLKLVQLRL